MSEPYVGEIRMFAGKFSPRGWAQCDGQLLATSQNDALFSLIGTIYGGDGRSTFGLPDMRGRVPVHAGTGPGLSPRRLGSKYGSEHETLILSQIPAHSHDMMGSVDTATTTSPGGNVLASSDIYFNDSEYEGLADLHPSTIGQNSGSQSHTNMMPFLAINFIISLFGIYPSRQ